MRLWAARPNRPDGAQLPQQQKALASRRLWQQWRLLPLSSWAKRPYRLPCLTSKHFSAVCKGDGADSNTVVATRSDLHILLQQARSAIGWQHLNHQEVLTGIVWHACCLETDNCMSYGNAYSGRRVTCDDAPPPSPPRAGRRAIIVSCLPFIPACTASATACCSTGNLLKSPPITSCLDFVKSCCFESISESIVRREFAVGGGEREWAASWGASGMAAAMERGWSIRRRDQRATSVLSMGL